MAERGGTGQMLDIGLLTCSDESHRIKYRVYYSLFSALQHKIIQMLHYREAHSRVQHRALSEHYVFVPSHQKGKTKKMKCVLLLHCEAVQQSKFLLYPSFNCLCGICFHRKKVGLH